MSELTITIIILRIEAIYFVNIELTQNNVTHYFNYLKPVVYLFVFNKTVRINNIINIKIYTNRIDISRIIVGMI